VFVRDASTDARVGNDFLPSDGVHALYGVPLVHEDEVVGVAHVGSTKSYEFPPEDRLLVSAFAERVAALIAARKRADAMEETARLRDLFLGMLGHDLRSPLHAIAGSAQLLLRRNVPEPGHERVLLRVLNSVDRMDRLIGDILDFARTRLGGGIPVVLGRVELTELCQAVIGESELARPGRVRFTSTLAESVECDGQRLAQVISNLLANAVEHAPESSTVDVQLFPSGADAVLTVHNEGPQIPPELLPYLFEPFRRGDRRRVGLGLYITREIVVAHRGSIEVHSPGQAGTTVTVRIPRGQPGAAAHVVSARAQ
jgi:signal transduction histidine kinase